MEQGRRHPIILCLLIWAWRRESGWRCCKGDKDMLLPSSLRGKEQGRKQRLIGWGAARKGELSPADTSGTGSCKGKGKSTAQPTTLPPTQQDLDIPPGVKIVDMALGASHSMVLLSDGRVIAWGSDTKGQISGLDEVEGVDRMATTWGGSHLLVNGNITSQGSTLHSNPTTDNMPPLPNGWKAEELVAGSEHLIVLANQGEKQGVWVRGWNEHGNLGLGDNVDRADYTRVEVEGRVKRIWGGCGSTWLWME